MTNKEEPQRVIIAEEKKQVEEDVDDELLRFDPYRPPHSLQLPYEYNTPVNARELAKIIFFTATGIALIRFIILLLCLVLCYICAKLATIGIDIRKTTESPLPVWRKTLLKPIPYLCRAALLAFGFYRLRVYGKPSANAAFCTPNHVSVFDGLILQWLFMPSYLAKSEVFKVPLLGYIFSAVQLIPVERGNVYDRAGTNEKIKRYGESQFRLEHERFPKLVIFPQGTCCDTKFLNMFQRGAFVPALPVQPIALKYNYMYFNPGYLVARKSDLYYLRLFCQFKFDVEVMFLPEYIPNRKERANSILYANNVRHQLAKVLNATVTDHTYEDVKLFYTALDIEENKCKCRWLKMIRPEEKVKLHGFELVELKRRLSPSKEIDALTFAQSALKLFSFCDKDGDGMLDFAEFSSWTGFSKSRQSNRIFQYFDRDNSGLIDFREFVLGMASLNTSANNIEKLKYAFLLLDRNADESVTYSEVQSFLETRGMDHQSENEGLLEHFRNALELKKNRYADGLTWTIFRRKFASDNYFINSIIKLGTSRLICSQEWPQK